MKKEDFRKALQEKLGKVPLKTRMMWNEGDLLIWWNEARASDSYLTWERAPGNVWQHVKGMCHDSIGPNAIW